MEAERFEVAGGTLVYDTFGKPDAARAVLLIHGFAGDRLSWLDVGARLGERHFVIVPDLPAHGDTTLEEDDVERLHLVLQPLLDNLGVATERLDIVGISMGGIVATRLAEALFAQGRAPRSLTLIASTGLGLECNQAALRGFAEGPTVGEFAHLLRLLARHVPEIPPEHRQFVVGRLGEGRLAGLTGSLFGHNGQRIDIVEALGRLAGASLPVRLAFGRADEILPWHHALNVPERVALHLFRDAGHMVHWDAPDALIAVIEG